MKVIFLCCNNEKFAYAYALEKSILSSGSVLYNVYGGVEELTKKLSELRWLLVKEMRGKLVDVDRVDEKIVFRIIENGNESISITNDSEYEFHVFPSKKMPQLSDYVKFLIGLQNSSANVLVIDNLSEAYNKNAELIYTLLPPESILIVESYPASRHFEVKQLINRNMVEITKMDWESDRITFM